MKKTIAIALILSTITFALLLACTARKSEPLSGKEFVAKNESIANGERQFMMHCQKCHPGAEGGLGPAISPNPAPGFVKRFQMRHGLGVMPAFKKDEITKKDLHDISKFLHAWKTY